MLMRPLTSRFVLAKSDLTLAELQWAFENDVVGARVVIDAASDLVANGDTSEVTRDLAGLKSADLSEVSSLLTCRLGEAEEVVAKAKWLWLVSSWVYEGERNWDALLGDLEGLYADFGYPEGMRTFGPYAPAYEGRRDGSEVRKAIENEFAGIPTARSDSIWSHRYRRKCMSGDYLDRDLAWRRDSGG